MNITPSKPSGLMTRRFFWEMSWIGEIEYISAEMIRFYRKVKNFSYFKVH